MIISILIKEREFDGFMDQQNTKVNYRKVLDSIKELYKRSAPGIVAIDGMCGSGKSYLASLIAENFDCNVFHMDDFFLPLEMKTKDRLEKPGANVHYERFKDEVLIPLVRQQTVIYRPYLCGQWKYGETVQVKPKKLTIIEGTYSMHPELRDAYDLKIFLSIDSNLQEERLRVREGEEKLHQFISKWIPLENLYFNQLNIKALCDIILDTMDF